MEQMGRILSANLAQAGLPAGRYVGEPTQKPITLPMAFMTLLMKYRKNAYHPPERLLCLDPGETTGWCLFINGHLDQWGQASTFDKEHQLPNWEQIEEVFDKTKPTRVVCENYRVYQHKLDQHSNADIFTLRLIGVIDYLSWRKSLRISYQMASMAKGFCTDEKLKAWAYWQTGMKHSRDAIRHGCYFMLFNKEEI